jgi:hypothetical protein
MNLHACTDRCSHRATSETLTAAGFPVKVTETCAGAVCTVREGTTFETAVFLATSAGVLRTCTRTGR